jgi:primosomal protein N' (replication factor Y)
MPRLISVAVPVPFLDVLTYRVPGDLDIPPVGARVLVPLGLRQVTGCIVPFGPAAVKGPWLPDAEAAEVQNGEARGSPGGPAASEGDFRDGQPVGDIDLKDVIDILDDRPFLPDEVVSLALWIAEYYACGAGEAIAAVMPPFAWIESEQRAQITAAGLQRPDPGRFSAHSPTAGRFRPAPLVAR